MQTKNRNKHFAAAAMCAAVLAGCGGSSDDDDEVALEVEPPPPAAQTTEQQVKELLAASDGRWATEVPPTGEARLQLTDACWRDNGRSKANVVDDINANIASVLQRDAYRIGEKRSNVQVLAERDSTNADGSARKEVDVQFDVAYADGSVAKAVRTTLISGSSSGTPGCTTPQTGTELRYFGNQQRVRFEVRGRNLRDERYSLAGAPLSPAVNYRRDLQFFVTDPMGEATYVIVSGPGPAGANGEPFSLKLISPRLLREAPELAGQRGNYLNWLDDDTFRFCRVSGPNVPVASVADCVGQGATGNNWGWTTATPNAAADTGFENQGWVAGGTYTVAVYNDDGWKTVNGHANRTPIATYTAVLEALPYRFVDIAGSGGDRLPRLSFGAMSAAQVAANLHSATPGPMDVSWSAPVVDDARVFRHSLLNEFFQGPKTGNAAGAAFPGYRVSAEHYLASTATALPSMPVTGKLPDMSGKSYAEVTTYYSDRSSSLLVGLVSFQ